MWVWCNNNARSIKLSSVVGPICSLELWQFICWHAWFGLHTATAEHHSRFWTVKTIKPILSSITSRRQKSDLGAHDCCVCNGFIYYPRIVICANEVADDSFTEKVDCYCLKATTLMSIFYSISYIKMFFLVFKIQSTWTCWLCYYFESLLTATWLYINFLDTEANIIKIEVLSLWVQTRILNAISVCWLDFSS
jgi:hypothetical protein